MSNTGFANCKRLRWVWALITFAATVGVARGHDPFEVTTGVKVRSNSIEMAITMSRSTAMAVCGDEKTPGVSFDPANFESFHPSLVAGAPKLYEVTLGGKALAPNRVEARLTLENDIEFHIVYPHPGSGTLRFDAVHLKRLPPEGYGAVLTVIGETGRLLGTKLLTADDSALDVALPPNGSGLTPAQPQENAPSFRAFLMLGIEHILTGYDHLLFLCALLVACRRFSSIAVIITCFTLAHSLTLALAGLNIVTLPSRVIEPLIAATIIFVGIENLLRRGEPPKRWMLTFAFGLIHGFGFAGALREAGLGTEGASLVVPLFSFNLGVELGQIAVAAVVLPILWQMQKAPTVAHYSRTLISLLVVLLGGFWLVQRVMF